MRFSIIVPVYNVEKYIEKCILSLKYQTFQNFEVLVLDDGSTDKSIENVKKIVQNDRKFKIIKKTNGGPGQTRNVGIKKASGEYLLFVDSDDYLRENALEIINNKIESSKKKPDVILFNPILDYGFVKKKKNVNLGLKGYFDIETNPTILNVASLACSKVVKRDFILKNNIQFTEGKLYEDIEYTFVIMALAKNVLFIDEYLYFYVQRPNSIMHSNNNIKDCLYVADQVLGNKKLKQFEDEIVFSLANTVLFVILASVNLTDYDDPIQYEIVNYVEEKMGDISKNKYFNNKRAQINLLFSHQFKKYFYRYNLKKYLKNKVMDMIRGIV